MSKLFIDDAIGASFQGGGADLMLTADNIRHRDPREERSKFDNLADYIIYLEERITKLEDALSNYIILEKDHGTSAEIDRREDKPTT